MERIAERMIATSDSVAAAKVGDGCMLPQIDPRGGSYSFRAKSTQPTQPSLWTLPLAQRRQEMNGSKSAIKLDDIKI